MAMGVTWEDEGWVERMLCLASTSRSEAVLPRAGSLWASRSTGRRCAVLWASEAQVCLSYDETRTNARKIHHLTDFLRLYSEV
jgi:hypothetical protein